MNLALASVTLRITIGGLGRAVEISTQNHSNLRECEVANLACRLLVEGYFSLRRMPGASSMRVVKVHNVGIRGGSFVATIWKRRFTQHLLGDFVVTLTGASDWELGSCWPRPPGEDHICEVAALFHFVD